MFIAVLWIGVLPKGFGRPSFARARLHALGNILDLHQVAAGEG